MKDKTFFSIYRFVLLVALFYGAFYEVNTVNAQEFAIFNRTQKVPEARDFATHVLGDPWDMNEFSDISQYINESGQRNVIRNPHVKDGIFFGTSAGDVLGNPAGAQNGWFFVLFPGYETAIHVGKVGSKNPIDSSIFKCLYIAMYVESPAANLYGPDQYRIFWFGDDRLNKPGSPYGLTSGVPLYPEYGSAKPNPIWKLYKLDLSKTPLPPGYPGVMSWNERQYWQGLRIDPTINANVNFMVDWVRLTSCNPQIVPISFTPNSQVTSVYLCPQEASYCIQVASDVDGNSGKYDLDVQGVAPGLYNVAVGDKFRWYFLIQNTVVTINQSPILRFENPDAHRGEDYATSMGNPWDMYSKIDYTNVQCTDFGQGDGILWLKTKPGSQQPSVCRGLEIQEADPKIYLNLPQPIDPSIYRYFSIRFHDTNPWQYVAKGTIMRIIWTVQGDSGRPGYECNLMSQDIPYDVGWNVYTVDLWDSFAGSAEAWQGECSRLPKNWRESSLIYKLRLDPNENITDHDFFQEIDWIRLTKPITIKRGDLFPIQFTKINFTESTKLTVYYTTSLSHSPTQYQAKTLSFSSSPDSGSVYKIYLPLVVNNASVYDKGEFDIEILWDTSDVSPGEYFLCALVDDGLNQNIACSDIPVQIQ